MKYRYMLAAAVLTLSLCLAGCASGRDTDVSASPDEGIITENPETPNRTEPNDILPGNDANEGGGAGGTDGYDNGMHNSGSDGSLDKDGVKKRDDGMLDEAGDILDKGRRIIGEVIDPNR